jgi:uncharacterized protein involved in high-affinity Fe2+ transport
MTLGKPRLAKPSLATIQAFAEGAVSGVVDAGTPTPMAATNAAPTGHRGGLVPVGDVRLTVNIKTGVHQALKLRSVQEHTTVGDMIEAWVADWNP